jgi:two-component system, NtrC family, response regulator AtoC
MAHNEQLLCIDGCRDFRRYISRQLKSLGYSVIAAADKAEAEKLLNRDKTKPRVTLLDPAEETTTGISIKDLSVWLPNSKIIALSGGCEARVIVKAIKQGADDYIARPFTLDELNKSIRAVLAASVKKPTGKNASGQSEFDFVYASQSMTDIRKTSKQVAGTSIPVLLTGESGVGKDVIARFIHQNSGLIGRPFLKVNCAAMPENLVESELFGYRKGAFTGAYVDRPGKFEYANGGTIFLDEIGEFSSSVQAKLLQVLQEGKFSMLGENREIEVDVRIVTATNRKLNEAIREGKFREDLYYRLNVINIQIPPLRERPADIPVLCEYFQKKFSREYQSEGTELSPALMEKFFQYPWPGNVRELENTIKRYMVLRDESSIFEYFSSRESGELEEKNGPLNFSAENYQGKGLKDISRETAATVEKEIIAQVLKKNGWNKLKTARELKVSYKTLLTKIEQYEIRPGVA